jgi:hypothetical protein
MEENGPDKQYGYPESRRARVEDDFMQQLTPIKGTSYRRLSAALPMAVVAVLVVATVAFGATVVRPLVVGPNPSATPVNVGDEQPDPEDSPSISDKQPDPTASESIPDPEPTKPATPVPDDLKLTAKLSGTKVVLTWTAYAGADFAYYKVVRSSDKTASWPLGEGDALAAAISDRGTLTFTDCPPTGKTWSYQVFAVKSTDGGFVVLQATNLVTIAVPAPTPKPTSKPTANCGIKLSASYKSGHVHLSWTKYPCSNFQYYVVGRSETNPKPDFPLPHEGVSPMVEIDSVGTLSWNDYDVKPGHTYYYRLMAWNSSSYCEGGTVLAKSNIVAVTIPVASTPTPAPTEPPAPPSPADSPAE